MEWVCHLSHLSDISKLRAVDTFYTFGSHDCHSSKKLRDYYYKSIRLRGTTRHCGRTVGHWICALLHNHLYLEGLKEEPIKHDL